jgi:membrane-associated phospholipid phosphatase
LAVFARRIPPWTLALAAASAVVFVLIAVLVALRLTAQSDLGWTRALQSVASDPLDVIANADTVVGQLAVTLPVAALVAVVARRRLGGHAWLGPLLILATGAIELVFKSLVAHPGPPLEHVRAFGNPLGVPRELQPPFAFPSGHVARITFLILVLAWLIPARVVVLGGAAFLIFTIFARVYIGDHWLSDVLGGAALGAGVAAAAIAWMHATRRR